MNNKRLMPMAFLLTVLWIVLTPSAASPQGTGVTVSVIDDARPDAGVFADTALTVSVLDANGNLIPDLTPQNFSVIENSRPIVPKSASAAFKPENRIAICLALDVSGSMGRVSNPATDRKFIDDVKQIANWFLESGLVSDDQVCAIAFSDKVENLNAAAPPKELPLTNNKNDTKNLIANLVPDLQRGKPLYDGVLKATKIATTMPAGARAVILIAEGRDERLAADGTTILSGSDTTAERTIDAAKEARIPIYTIGVGNDIDATYLKRLAEASGGRYQASLAEPEMKTFFGDIVKRLKTQYAVKYSSQFTPDGTDQAIQVRVKTVSGEAETRGVVHLPLIIPSVWSTLLPFILGAFAILVGIFILAILRGGKKPPTVVQPPVAPPTLPPAPVIPIPVPPIEPTGRATGHMPTDQEGPREAPSPQTVFIEKDKPVSLVFLVMERGDHPGREFPLRSDSTTIGRSGENDIPVGDSTVGRRQAKIRLEGRDYYLYDLADTNPTRVNDKPVRGRIRLNEKDRIQMGDTVFLFMRVTGK